MTALLLMALSLGQLGPTQIQPRIGRYGHSPVVFTDDASTVCHAFWTGAQLRDTKNCLWSKVGAVGQVSRSGHLPPSAGPFSDSAYYQLGTGLDALDFQGQSSWGICAHVKDASDSNTPVIIGNGQAGVAGWYLQKDASGNCSFAVTSSSGTVSVSTSLADTSPTGSDICCWGWQGSTILVKKNLGPSFSASGAAVGNVPATSIPAMLGRYPAATGFGYGGQIYELIASTSSGDSFFSAEAKHGLSALGTIPLAALGDSITYGYLNGGGRATTPYPAQLSSFAGSPFTVTNDGFSGYQVSQMQTVWTSNIQGRGYSYVVFLGGVNDIRGAVAQSTTITNTNALLDSIRADGSTLIIVNILPCAGVSGWTAGNQTELTALNANLASYASSHGVTLVDAYTAFGQPGNTTFLATAYDSGDGLHPNQAGYNLLASLVKTALGY